MESTNDFGIRYSLNQDNADNKIFIVSIMNIMNIFDYRYFLNHGCGYTYVEQTNFLMQLKFNAQEQHKSNINAHYKSRYCFVQHVCEQMNI